MARNTKNPAAGAAAKSTATPRPGPDSRAGTGKTSDDRIEDAVVVSEGGGPSETVSDEPKQVDTAASEVAIPSTASTDRGQKATAGGVSKAEPTSSVAPKGVSPIPDVAKASAAAPSATKSAAPKTTTQTGRDTIGPGSDATGPDPRLGRKDTVPKPDDKRDEDASASAGAPVSPSRRIAPPPSGRGGSVFVPLLLGGLVAGAIGYAIPTYIVPPSTPPVDTIRIDGLESGLAALTDKRAIDAGDIAALRDAQAGLIEDVDTLSGRISALEAEGSASMVASAPVASEAPIDTTAGPAAGASTGVPVAAPPASATGSGAELVALDDRVAQVEANGAATTERVTALDGRVDALAGRIDSFGADMTGVASDVSNLTTALDGVSGKVDGVSGDVAALRDDLGPRLATVEQGLTDATARATSVEDEAQVLARDGARSQVRAALASGAPYAEPLAVLGGDAPPELGSPAEAGVPTEAELLAEFPALARDALRTARAAGSEAGVGSLLRSAFGARSLEPRAGDDPDAVLSRAEAAARSGDLSGAVDEIEGLPVSAATVFADWSARARTRLDAIAAAQDFLKDG